MPVAKVHRISANGPDDASGIARAIEEGRIDPRGVIAVFGKTEGNGCVNDFSRGFATMTLTQFFAQFMPREQAEKICFVMSGGTEGAMAPHWTVFERSEGEGSGPALAIGRAHTAALPPEASRPCRTDCVGRRWRARGDARCGDCRPGRRAFRADQMPAADRAADRRSICARQDRRHLIDAEIHGAVAGRQRAWGGGRARRIEGGDDCRQGHRRELVAAFRPRQLLGRDRIAGP